MRCAAFLVSLAVVCAPSARAATFTPASGDVAALVGAITTSESNGEPTNVVVLPGNSTFTLTAPAAVGTQSGLPRITKSLTIRSDGSGTAVIERTGDPNAPIFRIVELGGGSADLTLQDVVVRGGVADTGGGILSSGDAVLTLTRVVVEHNQAGRGGGLAIEPDDLGTAGIVTIADSEFRDNQAQAGGGIEVRGDQTVDLTGTRILRNAAIDLPGDDIVAGGGGFLSDDLDGFSAPTVSLTDSTVSDNSVIGEGGEGGGIAVRVFDGALDLFRSTIARNLVQDVPGAVEDIAGGGLAGEAGAVITFENVTIVDNTVEEIDAGQAVGGGIGGGLDAEGADWDLLAVTLTGNKAITSSPAALGADGGGIGLQTGTLIVQASIVAGNQATTQGADCYPAETDNITSAGYNLVGGNLACLNFVPDTGDMTGGDPLLGLLGPNGGPTDTVAPGAGSPAIDAMPPIVDPLSGARFCLVETDQRGVARPLGAGCDIGAVEVTTTTTTTSTTLIGSTTTTTSVPGGTTTTTPVPVCPGDPTFVPTCASEPTPDSIECRLDELATEVSDAGDLGKLKKPLGKAVSAARTKASQARDVVGQKPPKAAKALKQGAKRLNAFVHKLRSRAASKAKVSDGTKARLLCLAQPLAADMQQLAAPR